MKLGVESIVDLAASSEVIRRRRYGVIDIVDGRLAAVRLRPWPKLVSLPEVLVLGRWCHGRRAGNRCRLFYNQPWRLPNFLAVTYAVSSRDCTLASMQAALHALDEVARIKRTDAIVCEAWNPRISDGMLARYGWQPHKPSRWHRHFIKRFYGQYPAATERGADILVCQ